MEAVTERKEARIQTAFRLKTSVLARSKREAERRGQSLNAYVEELLDRETRVEWPKLPKIVNISQEILDLKCVSDWKEPTKEELEADPRLAAILGY